MREWTRDLSIPAQINVLWVCHSHTVSHPGHTTKTVSARLTEARARKVSTSNSEDRARTVETLYLDLVIIQVLCVFRFCPFPLTDLSQLFRLLVCSSVLSHLKVALCPCITRKGLSGGGSGEEPACQCRRLERRGFTPWVGIPDPLKKEMATCSSILAWEILWTEEPGRLQYLGWQSQTRLSTHTHIIRKD